MAEINLYKNFNLSLADIYNADVNSLDIVEQNKAIPAKTGSIKRFIITFFIAILIFAVVTAGVLFYLKTFSGVTWHKGSTVDSTTQETNPDPATTGYVQIQVIEFAGDSNTPDTGTQASHLEPMPVIVRPVEPQEPPSSTSSATLTERPVPVEPSAKPNEIPAVKTQPQAAKQPAIPAKPPVTVPMYAIDVTGLTDSDYKVLKSLADSKQLKLTGSKETVAGKIWVVYKAQRGTGLFIEGVEVYPSNSFTSRAEALSYAENSTKSGETVLIKPQDSILESYSAKICCTDIDKAKLLAQESGITDKIFKIRKQ